MTETPTSIQAEKALIGSILIDPHCIWDVMSELVDINDLYDTGHRLVLESLVQMAERGDPVDLTAVSAHLNQRGVLEKAGGTKTLSLLMSDTPSALNAVSYARRVAETAAQRRLIHGATKLAALGYKQDLTPDERLEQAERIYSKATVRHRNGQLVSAHQLASDIHKQARTYEKDPVQPGSVRYLDTGWIDLNATLGGWRPGFYAVLAAQHVGKTWFALQAAVNAAMLPDTPRVLYIQLEGSAQQIIERAILSRADIGQLEYERGNLTTDQWMAFNDVAAQLSDCDLVLDDTSTSWYDILATIREWNRKRRGQLIVVDYLGLINPPPAANRNLELGALTRGLKLLSREIHCPIIVPHQISGKAVNERAYKADYGGKRPRLDDAYETGHLAQDADVILGLYRDQLYNQMTQAPNTIEVMVLKDRSSGRTGRVVNLRFSDNGNIQTLQAR